MKWKTPRIGKVPTYLVPGAIILGGLIIVTIFEAMVAHPEFWEDHADAFAVLVGFGVTIAVSMSIVIRHGDVAERRAKEYHDISMREMRRNFAGFLWRYRREKRELNRWHRAMNDALDAKLAGLQHWKDEAARELSGVHEIVLYRGAIIANLQVLAADLRANQIEMRNHFHERLHPIEVKFQLAGIKAAAKMILRGELPDNEPMKRDD